MRYPWSGHPFEANPPARVERSLYNRATDTVVKMVQWDDPKLSRLYARRLPGTDYAPIHIHHELESQSDAHCTDSTPYLIFNEHRMEKIVQPGTPEWLKVLLKNKTQEKAPEVWWGRHWLGIRRVNLATGQDVRVLDAESLRVPPPFSSGWVTEILSVTDDGLGAVCMVGLEGGRIRHFVYEVSFTDGLQRKIMQLEHPLL